MGQKRKKPKKKISLANLVKQHERRQGIIRLMIEDRHKSSCREMAERLADIGIETDKSTVNRDYNDPEFKRELRDCLFDVFDHQVIYHAADNIAESILEGNRDDSRWLMENCNFFPPPELRITGRMKAPGETTEEELAALLTPAVLKELYYDLTGEDIEVETDPSENNDRATESPSEPQSTS